MNMKATYFTKDTYHFLIKPACRQAILRSMETFFAKAST